ncbi:hypothetical protein [Bradyrhizobium sp. 1]|uniref:hypothetical protein n=1 Tax=Bradyrhizobium sp. 1 TaxID=241591 RepID=UPI001FFA0754|nr:hypothetical protein [Bradyrhizobium sp. 1]MCK1391627.1 hypothetical protein [Bradyrhizobium sp. 1]
MIDTVFVRPVDAAGPIILGRLTGRAGSRCPAGLSANMLHLTQTKKPALPPAFCLLSIRQFLVL